MKNILKLNGKFPRFVYKLLFSLLKSCYAVYNLAFIFLKQKLKITLLVCVHVCLLVCNDFHGG